MYPHNASLSCLCRSLRGVRVLCAHTSRPPGRFEGSLAPPTPTPPPRPSPPPKYKRSVIFLLFLFYFFFERRECVAVWASGMCEAVCSEVCVSFFFFFFEGLNRVGEGGRVAKTFFCSLEAFVTWLEMAKIKRWNKWTKTANYVCLVLCLFKLVITHWLLTLMDKVLKALLRFSNPYFFIILKLFCSFWAPTCRVFINTKIGVLLTGQEGYTVILKVLLPTLQFLKIVFNLFKVLSSFFFSPQNADNNKYTKQKSCLQIVTSVKVLNASYIIR